MGITDTQDVRLNPYERLLVSTRQKEAQDLYSLASILLNEDRGIEAVRKARMAARRLDHSPQALFNLAAILIDAAGQLGKTKYIREAIEYLTDIEDTIPPVYRASFHYNLGSAYAELGNKERGIGPGTRPSLLMAISHLDEALLHTPKSNIRTNLARVFLSQGRWIESLDEFNTAFQLEPCNHNALALRGSSLIGIYKWTFRHKGLLIGALGDHKKAEQLVKDDVASLRSYRTTIDNLHQQGISSYSPEQKLKSCIQEWIWEHGLGLNPCPICKVEAPDAFDLYPLAARLETPKRSPSANELIEIFNSLCTSYATARWCLYKAYCSNPREEKQVIILCVDENARHDLHIGLAMSALSGFYSILGQIAFGMNSCFKLGHKSNQVTFEKIWLPAGERKREIPRTRSQLHPKLTRYPCPALSALHALALSLDVAKGRYRRIRELRNHIEHRIVVPRTTSLDSRYFVTIEPSELESVAFEMGRIAKAAIWYFGGAVLHKEKQYFKRLVKRGKNVVKSKGIAVERR